MKFSKTVKFHFTLRVFLVPKNYLGFSSSIKWAVVKCFSSFLVDLARGPELYNMERVLCILSNNIKSEDPYETDIWILLMFFSLFFMDRTVLLEYLLPNISDIPVVPMVNIF